MKRVFGYGVSGVGIVLMVSGMKLIPFKIALLEGVGADILTWAGFGLVVVGVFLAMNKRGGSRGGKRGRGGEDEVPIYEGVGKKRRVVGYRAA